MKHTFPEQISLLYTSGFSRVQPPEQQNGISEKAIHALVHKIYHKENVYACWINRWGDHIFPANNLSTTAAKYICYSMHPRKHHPLFWRSNSEVHPEMYKTSNISLKTRCKITDQFLGRMQHFWENNSWGSLLNVYSGTLDEYFYVTKCQQKWNIAVTIYQTMLTSLIFRIQIKKHILWKKLVQLTH